MFFKNLDMLSPEITLFYNGEESHSSIISGILTIFYILILISFAGYFSLDLIRKKNPQTVYINSFEEDAGTYNINSSSLFHFINIEQKGRYNIELGFDFTKFRAIGFQTNFENYIYSKRATHLDHWLYGKCKNENYTKNIANESNYKFLEISACISKYYNSKEKKYYNTEDPNFKWPKLAHGTYNQNNTLYSIMIERCKNDALNLALGEEYKCSNNDTEFENFIDTEVPKTLNLYFRDNFIDILNYKNPYANFFNKIENIIYDNKYYSNNLYFNPSIVETNDGLFYDNINKNISYIFERNDENIRDQEGNNIYMGYGFYLKNMNYLYQRSYEKIQDVISNIGGINDAINIIFFYINVFINKYISIYDIKMILDSSIRTENRHNKNSNLKNRMKALSKDLSFNINEPKNTSYRDKFISRNLENKKERNNTETSISKKSKSNFIISNEQEDIDKFKNINKIKAKKLRPINKNDENHLFEEVGEINTKDFCTKETIESENKNHKENMNKNKDEDNRKNIKNDKNFNLCHYILYKITCGKKKKIINIYEDFREKILSEEHLVKNYLNIYNLLAIANDNNIFEKN